MEAKDAVTAKLSGGLGNQLFIFAAGYATAKKLGVPLIIDKSDFSRPGESRKYELGFLEDLTYKVVDRVKTNPAQRVYDRLNSNKIFREASPIQFDPRFDEIRPGTTLLGYFQSFRYFDSVKEDIITRLVSQGTNVEVKDSISLHLRRGDYLQIETQNFHGLSTARYASRALETIRSITGHLPAYVYSDNLEIVRHELEQYSLIDLTFVNQDKLTDIESLVQMSQSQHMVMSNSSFSWWAAFLMHCRSGESVVIAPRPWFSDDSSASDLLLPDWITLDKR
jgi:hypothetical protein